VPRGFPGSHSGGRSKSSHGFCHGFHGCDVRQWAIRAKSVCILGEDGLCERQKSTAPSHLRDDFRALGYPRPSRSAGGPGNKVAGRLPRTPAIPVPQNPKKNWPQPGPPSPTRTFPAGSQAGNRPVSGAGGGRSLAQVAPSALTVRDGQKAFLCGLGAVARTTRATGAGKGPMAGPATPTLECWLGHRLHRGVIGLPGRCRGGPWVGFSPLQNWWAAGWRSGVCRSWAGAGNLPARTCCC